MPPLLQRPQLLGQGAVEARVPGVQAHGGLARRLGPFDDVQHLLQRHVGAVVDLAPGLDARQVRPGHQAAGVDDHVGFLQQPRSAHGDQIGRAAARPDKVNHPYPSTKIMVK